MGTNESENPLIDYIEQACNLMVDTARRKNADYTGGADPFANFVAVEQLGICGAETGILARMLDKFMRVRTFIAKGALQVKDETVEDTLFDLANYSLILAALVNERRSIQAIKDTRGSNGHAII